MKKLYLLKDYLIYFFKATNQHGIHSPFVYELYNNVIKDQTSFYAFADIESIRAMLLLSNQEIDVKDFGAGSKLTTSNKRKISSIVKNAAKSPKYGQLLFRLVNRFKPSTVLEIGTSLGISTMYLAATSKKTNVITIEGCPTISKIATINFKKIGFENITLQNGKFDEILPKIIAKENVFDFVFFDGNHTEKATIIYFNWCLEKANEQSIFVFDDIYWSEEMKRAWQEIKKHPKVTSTIDLFFLGIVFFNSDLSKEHFVLRF
ncbi:MAG: SAM-dependent methyltransferase [Bacteroidetes bacterium HGW-Bacteroidetes-12]|nr:MAG: SAM-dependent methyltransferase [Bacteroidetes bacterium HGW-Bacteroidetes-12]